MNNEEVKSARKAAKDLRGLSAGKQGKTVVTFVKDADAPTQVIGGKDFKAGMLKDELRSMVDKDGKVWLPAGSNLVSVVFAEIPDGQSDCAYAHRFVFAHG